MSAGPLRYSRLSLVEKEAAYRTRMREEAVSCPACLIRVMPFDLLRHVEASCSGRPAVHPASRWVSAREAVRLVPERTLRRWVSAGAVRTRGERERTRYLLRDLVVRVALRRLERQRR